MLTLDNRHVTRPDQAAVICAEMVRRTSRPAGTIELHVRRYHAAGLLPGAKVMVDIDPEPGGGGSEQMAVVRDRREDATGPVRLTVVPDTLVEATPYSPAYTAETPLEATCPALDPDDCLVIPLPPSVYGMAKVGILAPRPSVVPTGVDVYFGLALVAGAIDPSARADLGAQIGFSCRMTLDEDVDEDETVITLSLEAGAGGPDAYLSGRLPADAHDAEQDILLLVLANLDVNDRVQITDGFPEMEMCSIVSRAAVDTDTHDYTVLRARRGTSARSWQTFSSPRAYIVPLANIVAWSHPAMSTLLASGDPGYIEMVAYSATAEDDTSPVPLVSIEFPAGYDPRPILSWVAPSGSQGATDGAGDIEIDLTVSDYDGDLVSVRVDSREVGGTMTIEHHAATFEPSAAYDYSATLNFSEGSYLLTVTAMDRAGNITTGTRTIVNVGAGLLPPSYDPSEIEFIGYVVVTLTVVGPADQVQWATTSIGDSNEPSTWNETSIGTLTKAVTLTSSRRLWSRAKDSDPGDTSAAVFVDYWKNVG